jgi:hypothetical protein
LLAVRSVRSDEWRHHGNGRHTPIDKAKAAELLAAATQLQAAFWDALSDLEGALDGIELDGTRDLSETTLDELMEEAEEDGDNTTVVGIEPN